MIRGHLKAIGNSTTLTDVTRQHLVRSNTMSDLSVGKPLPTPIFSRGWVRETEPVRATIKRARRTRAHGVFAMPTGGSKTWFTLPQRDLICLLAVDPGVRSFELRPFTLRLPIDAKQFDHTPDFRILRAGEQAIVDITRPPNPESRSKIIFRFCRAVAASVELMPSAGRPARSG